MGEYHSHNISFGAVSQIIKQQTDAARQKPNSHRLRVLLKIDTETTDAVGEEFDRHTMLAVTPFFTASAGPAERYGYHELCVLDGCVRQGQDVVDFRMSFMPEGTLIQWKSAVHGQTFGVLYRRSACYYLFRIYRFLYLLYAVHVKQNSLLNDRHWKGVTEHTIDWTEQEKREGELTVGVGASCSMQQV